MANCSLWPNQPWIGERSASCSSAATYRYAGRARAGVEVLVGAADGQLRARAAQVDRHRAGGVREVPDQRRAALARRGRQRRHVGQRARAVGDVGEHDDVAGPAGGEVGGSRPVELVGVEQPQLERRGPRRSPRARSGRWGSCRGRVTSAPPRVERRLHELVEVDRRRVGGDHLAGLRRRSARRARRRRAAAGRSTRASRRRARTPHSLDRRVQPLARGEREPAERVAVEVEVALVAQLRSARGSPRAGRRRRAPRRARGRVTPAIAPRPPTAGSPGRCGRSGPRRRSSTGSTVVARRPRRRGEARR